MQEWHVPAPITEDVNLVENEIAPAVAGIIVLGVVALAGVGYGAYCTYKGNSFNFEMNLQSGVKMSCR